MDGVDEIPEREEEKEIEVEGGRPHHEISHSAGPGGST